MDQASALIYWAIVPVWIAVVVTALAVYLRYRATLQAAGLLLMVVIVDGTRNIVENVYFGLYFGSKYGVLPAYFRDVLGQSHYLILPKLMNIVAACFVLWLLVLRCMPKIFRDQASAQTALAIESEEHRRLLENSPELIVVTGPDRVIRRISHSCEQILGYPPSEMVGRYGGQFLDQAELPGIRDKIRRAVESGQAQKFEAHFLHRDGHLVPLEVSAVWSPLAQRIYLIGRDVTETYATKDRLRELAHFDQLTKLPNRNTLLLDLEQRIIHPGPFTIVMFDLDGFKEINDALGHAAGDDVLRNVAEMAVKAAPDATVYRLGGDEFVMLFPDLGDPLTVARRIQDLAGLCEAGFGIAGRTVFLGISAGICTSAQTERDMDEMIYCADLALYHAKASGGHKIKLFEATMRAAGRARQELEKELRIATIERQFELFYQPQIRLSDGRLVGAEALLRWRHPVRGLLAPADFIDILAHSPLALTVGKWVLDQACADAAGWNARGLGPIRVGVNLFSVQYSDRELVNDVVAALETSGLRAECLELEVTEDIALSRHERAPGIMRELRALGVGIAFDDFGTGYASLSYLMQYPLTRVKIDRSFVRNITGSGEGGERPIVRAIIAMAHGLNLEVVAEGVETAEQAAVLQAKGCDEVQGYFYGRPMPAVAFEAFAADGRMWSDDAGLPKSASA